MLRAGGFQCLGALGCAPLLREAKLSLGLVGHILELPECFKEYL